MEGKTEILVIALYKIWRQHKGTAQFRIVLSLREQSERCLSPLRMSPPSNLFLLNLPLLMNHRRLLLVGISYQSIRRILI
jgi:hypothetical protein